MLKAIDGVQSVKVSLEPGEAVVEFAPGRVDPAHLRSAIEDAGYEVARYGTRHRGHGPRPQADREALLKRLNRIAGQVRGVAGMVEEERYCVDVLTQIAAIRSALDAVAMQLLEDHAHGCVQEAMRAGRGEQAVDEFMTVVKRLSR